MKIAIDIAGVAGIERARLEANPIALVTGHNGAGKTSIAQAVGAALSGNPLMRGISQKNRLNAVVRSGFETGEIRLSGPGGEVTVQWPEGKTKTKGNPPAANEIAAGKIHLMAMGDADRFRFLTELLGALPTREDLGKALADWNTASVDKLWKSIADDGWDGTHRKAKDAGTRLKGAWENVTKDRFGKAKAASWLPANWTDDLEGQSVDRLESELAEARTELEGAVGHSAVDEEKARKNRLLADKLPSLNERLPVLEAELSEATETLDAKREHRDGLPDAHDGSEGLPCPHGCKGKLIAIVRTGPAVQRLEAVEPRTISDDELKKRRKAISSADGEVGRAEGEVDRLTTALADLKREIESAEEAEKQLESTNVSTASQESVDKAREAVRLGEQRIEALKARTEAESLRQRIDRNQILIDLLDPKGLRKTVLEDALGTFNSEHLAPRAKAMGVPAVTLDEDMGLRMGGRSYGLLSAGEQFAVDAVVQVAVALMTAADMVVVDGADKLVGKQRSGLLKMLAKANIPAVVTVALKNAAGAPDLAAGGHGATYWVEDGTAEQVGAGQEDKAA